MNTTIFDYFNKLCHPSEKERNKSAAHLLQHLSKLKDDEDEQRKERDYILKRTIRGLGSINHKNKEIYYSLLASYLSLCNNVSTNKILELMDNELHPSSGGAKSEKADIYFGRILTYGALIRSKVIQNCDPNTEKQILEGLLYASKQRSYLAHCATSFIINFIENIEEEHFKNHVWPILEKEVFKPWKDQTLDSFYMLLILRQKFPKVVAGKEIKKHFGSKDIVSKENVSEILRILLEIPRIICSNHPIYEIIVEKAVKKGIAIDIWVELDKKFTKPSKTTEYVAVKLVEFICKLDTSIVPDMLTPNFLHYIMKSCQLCKNSKKDEATALLRESLIKIVNVINETEMDIKMDALKKMLFYPGDLMIEKKTGVKVLSVLYTKLTVENVKELTNILRKIITNQSKKEIPNTDPIPWNTAERIYSVQMLTKLLGHSKMISEHDWRLHQLKFLFKNGLCEQEKSKSDIAGSIKECFYRAIDHKLASLEDLKSVLTSLVTELNNHLFVEKTWTLQTPLDENAVSSWKKMFKLMKKLDKNTTNKSLAVTFGTMNLHMGLQLFQDTEMAIPSIDDLQTCYEKITSQEEEKLKEDEPHWVEVVVDLMLSLLSRKNHLLRSVVNCVFPHICPYLTSSAVHHIISVLNVNDKQPLTPVKRNEDSDESSDSESESDEESEEEKEMNGNANNHANNEKEDDEEDEDEDDDEDDENESDMEEDNENQIMMNQLKMNLQQVLGDAAGQSDVEDMDVDDISEEEGKRLDLSLAAAFKVIRENRRMKSKRQTKNEEILTHFRIRVIDLLEIYLEHSPSMALALDMIVPLFVLLEHCIQDRHQKPLQNRVRACLTKLSSVKKFADTNGVDEQIILDILKVLLEKGERSAAIYLEMGDKLPQSCTFLIRCLQQTKCSTNSIVEFIREKLSACFKRSILPLTIFKNILKLCWEDNFKLVPVIADVIFDETVRPFLKNHALELLSTFYMNDRLFSTVNQRVKKSIEVMEQNLYENTLRILKVCVANEEAKEVKQTFLAHLFMAIKVIYVRHINDCWKSDEMAQVLENVKSKLTSKLCKVAYNKLIAVIKRSENKGTKRQNEDNNSVRKKKSL